MNHETKTRNVKHAFLNPLRKKICDLKRAFHCYNIFIFKISLIPWLTLSRRSHGTYIVKNNFRLVKSGENYSFFLKPEVTHAVNAVT